MKDTDMDMYPDPCCIPTMGMDYGRLALEWKVYIEWVLSEEAKDWGIDPMDASTVY